jgi:hypothetical protein
MSRSQRRIVEPTAGSTARSRAAVAAITVALLGVISYANIYLPYFSPEAQANRERTAAGRVGSAESGRPADLAPGSMWKAMGEHRDAAAAAAASRTPQAGAPAPAGSPGHGGMK